MTNYIADDTSLDFPKVDRRAIPPGESEEKFVTAANWNTHCQATEDLKNWLRGEHLNAKAYGAAGDNSTDDSAAIQSALEAAAAASVSSAYGRFVYLPPGIYRIGSQITIPNGVGIRGAGPSSSVIKATNSFSAASMIANETQDGTQEYAFLEGLMIDGNKGGGAVCSTAVVDFVSLFINSYLRDVVILQASNVGLRLAARNGMGPVLIENCWVLRSNGHNVLLEEEVGNGNAFKGMCFINLTTEHQASGKAAIYLKGVSRSKQWNFYNTHIEMVNGGAGTRSVIIDGVSNVHFDGLQLQCGSISGVTGVEILDNSQNLGIQLRGVTNTNLIDPVIDDQKNDVQLGAVNVPIYCTADVGLWQSLQGEQTLTYGTSVDINCALGNYCILVANNTTAFTINAPSNGVTGTEITFEIVNTSGGSMGTITWDAAFAFKSTWTNPANNKRKTIRFRKRSAGNWIQIGSASGDM